MTYCSPALLTVGGLLLQTCHSQKLLLLSITYGECSMIILRDTPWATQNHIGDQMILQILLHIWIAGETGAHVIGHCHLRERFADSKK